jgi:trans-aconitate methyltransferase
MNRVVVMFCMIITVLCSAMQEESPKWDAALYDECSAPQFKISKQCIDSFDFSSDQFQTLLELGCNTANICAYLAEKYPYKKIIGIDPEGEAIEFAKEKHKQLSNLSLLRGTAQKFRLIDGHERANFIGCYHVLHWIPRAELHEAFSNIACNLNERGILDVFTSAKQETTPLTKAVLRTILKIKWWWYIPSCIKYVYSGQNSLSLLTAPELRAFAEDAGLVIDRCEEVAECCSFDSKEKLVPWLISILKPYGIEATLKERQQEFAQEIADLYTAEYNPGTNDSIEYHFKGLRLIAHKP